ncbi:MAG: helix-turn-helix transcriptional regulator [Acidobacteria bacterium]|nr:helix-turn-helix transcriptional regulator [Acidobacteriota bacterium]
MRSSGHTTPLLRVFVRIPEWHFSFGQRLKYLRRALSWSQDHADQMLGAGKGVVRQYEVERRRWPRLPLLRQLRKLEEIYAEQIRAYLAVADSDKRRRIHYRPAPIHRPPDLQEALAGVGTVDSDGPPAERDYVPEFLSRIQTTE